MLIVMIYQWFPNQAQVISPCEHVHVSPPSYNESIKKQNSTE